MSQKIDSDRTELEGVDLPGAGQTKMLVIDEDKKIKSEDKPTIPTKTSELENDSGFITSSDLPPQSLQDVVNINPAVVIPSGDKTISISSDETEVDYDLLNLTGYSN